MPRTGERPVFQGNGESETYPGQARAEHPHHVSKGWVKMFVMSSIAAAGVVVIAAAWFLVTYVKGEQALAAEAKLGAIEKAQKDFQDAHAETHKAQDTQQEFFKATLLEMNERQKHEIDDVEQLKDTIGAHMEFTGDKKAALHLKPEKKKKGN